MSYKTLREKFRLSSYYNQYATDKFNLGYIDYIYDDLFTDRISPRLILEIGACNGESLRLWHDWFINAQVHGIDNGLNPSFNSTDNAQRWIYQQPRVTIHIGDAYSDLIQSLPHNFDIIIDDGPHTVESQQFCAANYTKKLQLGGILIIEDILNSNSVNIIIESIPNDIDADITIYHMNGKQKTIELRNKFPNGLDAIVIIRNH